MDLLRPGTSAANCLSKLEKTEGQMNWSRARVCQSLSYGTESAAGKISVVDNNM